MCVPTRRDYDLLGRRVLRVMAVFLRPGDHISRSDISFGGHGGKKQTQPFQVLASRSRVGLLLTLLSVVASQPETEGRTEGLLGKKVLEH